MNLKDALNWRYAVKKYTDQKVSEADVQAILEATNLSASSAGMQPYRVIVVKNADLRKQLGEGSFNPQITEASDLLVFAAYQQVTEQMIDDYIQMVADERGMPVEMLADFKNALKGNFLQQTPEQHFTWAARQAYIGLGTALIAAADLHVDSTPMEGFDRDKFDQLLGLTEKGLKSVVMLSLGYRDEEKDFLAKAKKVRLPLNQFVIEVA